jgi:hypothetical protein
MYCFLAGHLAVHADSKLGLFKTLPICATRGDAIVSAPFRRTKHAVFQHATMCAQSAHVTALKKVISETAGADRGIFSLDSALRARIHDQIEKTEALSPTPEPTMNDAEQVRGTWRLLYTTLTILGRKRVRLALATSSKPGFVSLGELYQIVDCERKESRNVVVFNTVLGGSGTFTVTANYQPVSQSRVEIQTKGTVLEPAKLEKLLGSNLSLLAEIFDPTGHLDITYLDATTRIGRDHANNIFVLERCEQSSVS